MCLRLLGRQLLDVENSPITEEHVPPKRLGGKVRTLTCAECNNWAGTELDSSLANYLDQLDFREGLPGATVDAVLTVNNSIQTVGTVRHTAQNAIEIITDPGRTHPLELKKAAADEPRLIRFTTSGKRGRLWRARRPQASLLRTAYLYAFSVFGYGFLINSWLSEIRKQINYPMADILPTWGINENNAISDELVGVSVVARPAYLRSHCVVLDLQSPLKRRRFSTFLPGPQKPGLAIYQHLKEAELSGIQFELRHYDELPEFITDEDYAFASGDNFALLTRES